MKFSEVFEMMMMRFKHLTAVYLLGVIGLLLEDNGILFAVGVGGFCAIILGASFFMLKRHWILVKIGNKGAVILNSVIALELFIWLMLIAEVIFMSPLIKDAWKILYVVVAVSACIEIGIDLYIKYISKPSIRKEEKGSIHISPDSTIQLKVSDEDDN